MVELTKVADGALFQSIDAALRFAFDIEHYPVMARPPLAQWLTPTGRGRARGMVARDWHAQGALIRRYVSRLEQPHGADYVSAFFARGAAKERAIRALLALPEVRDCLQGSRVPLEPVLRRYCANCEPGTPTLRTLARQLDVSHTTVMRAEYRLKDALSRVFMPTEARIRADFERFGLVQPE
jgi:hypothetical protein